MKLFIAFISLLLSALSPLTAYAQETPLETRAELTNYQETSSYADVMKFIKTLEKRTDNLRIETFGKSEEGRDLPLMIFSNDAQKSEKPVVFVMASIHAGEVEGKEALLALSRRLAYGDLKPLLDKLTILIAPIYNADGSERMGQDNRPEQNGPIGGVGTRVNAKGLNLNRDYMKLDSTEAQALVKLMNRWDPHLTVDLHTTNGSYHGYHLTYSPTLNPNADPRLIAFERNKMLKSINKTMLSKHKFRTYYYGNFSYREKIADSDKQFAEIGVQAGNKEQHKLFADEVNEFTDAVTKPGEPERTKMWRTFTHHARFGSNYVGLRNRLAILSETYSYLDFSRRIESNIAFVEEIFKYSAEHAKEIMQLTKQVDADMVKRASGKKPVQFGVEFELTPLPKPVDILVGVVEKKKNPISGRNMLAMVEDKFTPLRMPDYGIVKITKSVTLPHAYIFRAEPGLQKALNNLSAHGVKFEKISAPLTVEVEQFVIDDMTKDAKKSEGHHEIKLTGHTEKATITFPAGSILVRTAQPRAPLAFTLLEARSDDSLAAWNFMDDYLEKGKVYPIYKIMTEPKATS